MRNLQNYLGMVGNGETVALIDPEGRISWFCAPRFDSFPLFAAALDPYRGGFLRLHFPAEARVVYTGHEYYDRTNVLQTFFKGAGFHGVIIDFMPWQRNAFIRLVKIKNTTTQPLRLPIEVEVVPVRTSFRPFVRRQEGNAFLIFDQNMCLYLLLTISKEALGFPRIELSLPPGGEEEFRLVMGYGRDREEAEVEVQRALEASLGETVRFWEQWLERARIPSWLKGPLRKAYCRSLLALKLLTHHRSGAILAAPTASFPATPGGKENWDYRYCWIRDGFLTAMAFDEAGLHQEARKFYDFILPLQAPDGSWPHPLYTIDGTVPTEVEIMDLEGPNGEKPIRFGNEAAIQLQLDNEGSVLYGLWYHYALTRDKAYLREIWPAVRKAAFWLRRNWFRAEHGIWEFRGHRSQWTYGKAVTYGGLLAAARLAQELGFGQLAGIWRGAAYQMQSEVVHYAWSEKRQAFTQLYDDDSPLDISVLALVFYGLVSPRDPRMLKTIQALEGTRGCLIYRAVARYECAILPFALAQLWLARYHLRAGNLQRAWELTDMLLSNATSLYLWGEHFDPETGKQWGNFPQTFVHAEFVRNAWAWQRAMAGRAEGVVAAQLQAQQV
ncbi:glycoside hydrolase 15-related protein [Ammonifex degensii KC4]|uniref:Glycoside hydrolase 15-related protein n=1 Tax=Ammonifex degensii (strain DSM 10501 / KC4) TaxID=429009 RepID=C9RC19_AMMDK|nr:glycoside hydrolase family 15 protein [Ammonifex degensii]ACX51796.1 glycoside hydrolase 15-related protein [Ammonifex degensii KC4]